MEYEVIGWEAITAPVVESEMNEVGIDGSGAFENPAYFMFSQFPPLGLSKVESAVPVSPRMFGLLGGG